MNKVISFIFPHLLIKETDIHSYNKSEKETTRFNLRIILPFISITYICHYFYFDKPMGLAEQSEFWFYFRFGMALFCLLGFVAYRYILSPNSKNYRGLAVLTLSTIVVMQAYATKLYPEAPSLYPFVFTLVSLYILRLTVVQNIIFCLVNTSASAYFLLQTPHEEMDIYSATFITLVITLFLSSRNITSILLFKSNLEKLAAQKELIERQIEMVNHLRGFLPKEIFKRFHDFSSKRKYSMAYALDEILRPQNKEICCLFSDIRGYTQHSKNSDTLEKQILPMIQKSTSQIEDHKGIPRKIGDLIFAYFDEDQQHSNIVNSLYAAASIAHTQSREEKQETKVNRSIILACGNAIVGNVGGTNSAIEITAMGTPPNQSARIDEFIKRHKIFYNKIVFSPDYFDSIRLKLPRDYKTYKLKDDEEIRDFPEIRNLQYISFEQSTELFINQAYSEEKAS